MIQSIDIHSSVAVYIQIENHVQFAIASGRLKPGDKLPSVRELSERLGVNPNTIANAYRDLEVMGLLYTRRGMGVFINKDVGSKCGQDCRKRIIGRFFEVISEAKAAGMSRKEVLTIVEASIAVDATLYGETPSSLIALAKQQQKSRKQT